MALSLLYNPGEYFSAHGDVIFTLLEDTKPFNSGTYPDYKYVCDVYIGGVQVVRLKAFPRPGDKIGVFDIGNIVRNYLTNPFLPNPNAIHAQSFGADSFYVNAICRFGEEYGNVTYSNIIVDSQRSYFNNYNGRLFGTTTNLTSVIDKPMTVRPYTTPVDKDAKFCLVPFLSSDDSQYLLDIKCYSGNTLIRQASQSITPTALSTNEVQVVNLSPTAINASSSGLIDSAIEYYTVTFNTPNIVGDTTLKFNLKCEARFDVYTLHFMNRFGSFESREFSKVSRSIIESQKNDFGQSSYLVKSNGQVSQVLDYPGSKTYLEQKSVYAVAWSEKMTLNTDILTDDEYKWLRDLIISPMIYIELDDYFFPIIITNNNYEQKKVINDDLTNLTINIEYGDRFNTQYR